MDEDNQPLELLGPVPTKEGECSRRVIHEPPHVDWVEVRVVLGAPTTGRRIVTALFDADDQPGAVSDIVTVAGGQRQITVSGQVAAGGRLQGTYKGSDATRPLTEAEVQGLRAVFASMRQRYP